MPTHRDMPQSWQEHARRRSDEVTHAVERARSLREASATTTLPQLAQARRARLEAADAARGVTSFPPPPSAA